MRYKLYISIPSFILAAVSFFVLMVFAFQMPDLDLKELHSTTYGFGICVLFLIFFTVGNLVISSYLEDKDIHKFNDYFYVAHWIGLILLVVGLLISKLARYYVDNW